MFKVISALMNIRRTQIKVVPELEKFRKCYFLIKHADKVGAGEKLVCTERTKIRGGDEGGSRMPHPFFIK